MPGLLLFEPSFPSARSELPRIEFSCLKIMLISTGSLAVYFYHYFITVVVMLTVVTRHSHVRSASSSFYFLLGGGRP